MAQESEQVRARWRLLLSLCVLLLLWAVGPRPTPAQSPATARLEVTARLTSVHHELAPLLGAAALVRLSDRWSIGGGGWILLPDREVEGEGVFPRQQLGFGYGGLVIEVGTFSIGGLGGFAARTLFGAGNAELRDVVTGTRLASDNMLVVEPEILLGFSLAGRMSGGVGLSYRHAWRVQDLGGLGRGDLSGLCLALYLRIGPL